MSGNLKEFVNGGTVLDIWAIVFSLIMVVYFGINLITKNQEIRRKVLHSVCVAVVVFFNFGTLDFVMRENFEIERSRLVVIAWVAVFALSVILTWRISRHPKSSKIIAIAGSALALSATFPLIPRLVNTLISPTPDTENTAVPGELADKDLPSVYYFILDGYGRADFLKSELGFDNSPFLKNIKKLGFKVLEKSTANFPVTKFSISSTLSMSYVIKAGANGAKDYLKYQTLLGGYNPVVQMFQDAGYSYVHVSPGSWDATRCRGDKILCIPSPKVGINETQASFLAATPLEIFIQKFLPGLLTHQISELPYVMDRVMEIREQVLGPVFLFSHLMIPHDMIYDRDCTFIGRKHRFMSFIPNGLAEKYINTINCLNNQLLTQIPRLLEQDPNAVIILQSDHGFMSEDIFVTPYASWPKNEVNARYSILNLMRVPEKCQEHAYTTMSAVNTFRFIRACLFDMKPTYLPDRAYFAVNHRNDVVQILKMP